MMHHCIMEPGCQPKERHANGWQGRRHRDSQSLGTQMRFPSPRAWQQRNTCLRWLLRIYMWRNEKKDQKSDKKNGAARREANRHKDQRVGYSYVDRHRAHASAGPQISARTAELSAHRTFPSGSPAAACCANESGGFPSWTHPGEVSSHLFANKTSDIVSCGSSNIVSCVSYACFCATISG